MRVVVAPERAKRPGLWSSGAGNEGARGAASSIAQGPDPECPLCGGHESWTPPETYALRPAGGPPDSGGWLVRAVPNKYPVLAAEEGALPEEEIESARGEPDLFVSGPARGEHEVIVHSPEHLRSIADLSADQLRVAIEGWRERLSAHAGVACAHLIVNEGATAGASLEHTHAQLYALGFVPARIARERERFTAHNTRTMGGCLLCDLLQEEVRRRERVVAITDGAVLLAPFASRMPFELQIVPRRHAPSLVDAAPDFAPLLLDALGKLERALGARPPLNMWLRVAPRGAAQFHWRLEILPRLTQLAGLELGAGIGVNVYSPERVAADLRAL